ncbi:MAG TPA: iron-sulfur cluster assembly scaffold protein, partial [Planctomycetota bacterium]|nr:iron-sulfur cluster assembly scaffold protein [Planctomycetota bacterium]
MNAFPEHLRDHFERPRNVGEPQGGADRRGEALNAACGDRLVVYLQCEAAPDGRAGPASAAAERVRAAGFRAQGCPAALATASAACSLLAGLPADASLPGGLAERF